MKVIIFTDTFLPDLNGVATSSHILYEELLNHGHEVMVVTSAMAKHSDYVDGVNIVRMPGFTLKRLYGYRASTPYSRRAMRAIKAFGPEIVHIQTEFTVGIFGRYVASQLHLPIVYTYHTQYDDYSHYLSKNIKPLDRMIKKFISSLTRAYGEHCAELIVPSDKTKNLLYRYGIKNHISVIPTGLDLKRFAKENVNQQVIDGIRREYHLDQCLTLIYLGRIAQEKSIDLLIDGIDLLKDEMPDIRLMIVGGGPDLKPLKEKAKQLLLDDFIIFTGPKKPEEVPYYYHACDVFTGASVSETQGLTYIEAMACGLPVLARYDKNLENVVLDGVNGYFFNNLEEFCRLVKHLKSRDLRDLSQHALELAQKYSSEIFYQKVLLTYQRVIREVDYQYKITAIHKLGHNRYEILCENENMSFTINVSSQTFERYGLMLDMILNDEEVEALKDLELVEACYNKALSYLSYHDYSYDNMRKRLTSLGEYDDLQIEQTMELLMEKNLINDRDYAMTKYQSLLHKGRGIRKIIAELKKDGITDTIINDVLMSHTQEAEVEQATALVQKYFKANKRNSPQAFIQSVSRKLFNRGYTSEIIDQAIDGAHLDFRKEHTMHLLKQEYERVYKRYVSKYKGRLLRTKIITFLVQKGYQYDDVLNLIDTCEEDFDEN